MSTLPVWRARLLAITESKFFQYFITALIVMNAVILGLETSPAVMQHAGSELHAVDTAILTVFVLELLLRIGATD